MRIVKPSYVIYDEDMPVLQAIELAGRTCYKSEDKITVESAPRFVKSLMSRGHFAMIEHGVIHMVISNMFMDKNVSAEYMNEWMASVETLAPAACRIIRTADDMHHWVIVTANLRTLYDVHQVLSAIPYPKVAIEYQVMMTLHKYLPDMFAEPALMPLEGDMDGAPVCEIVNNEWMNEWVDADALKQHMHHTIRFTCDRGVSHELVRHRPASFAQMSTRYCNYSQDKFSKEISFIEPCFWEKDSPLYHAWAKQCESAEQCYFAMLGNGAKPEEARSILPNSLLTEIVVTANEEEWQHIFDLRAKGTTGKPHPQMAELMVPLWNEMKERTGGRIK